MHRMAYTYDSKGNRMARGETGRNQGLRKIWQTFGRQIVRLVSEVSR